MKIYLAGYINDKVLDKCIRWRKKIRDYYDNWKGKEKYPIIWLDPCNGETLGSIELEGMKCKIPGKALVHRDFNDVKTADLLIVNTDTFGENRPLVGTIYELAWAWYLKKPVIMINRDPLWANHPFSLDTVSIYVSTVEELLEKKHINYFFKGTVSANY